MILVLQIYPFPQAKRKFREVLVLKLRPWILLLTSLGNHYYWKWERTVVWPAFALCSHANVQSPGVRESGKVPRSSRGHLVTRDFAVQHGWRKGAVPQWRRDPGEQTSVSILRITEWDIIPIIYLADFILWILWDSSINIMLISRRDVRLKLKDNSVWLERMGVQSS